MYLWHVKACNTLALNNKKANKTFTIGKVDQYRRKTKNNRKLPSARPHETRHYLMVM